MPEFFWKEVLFLFFLFCFILPRFQMSINIAKCMNTAVLVIIYFVWNQYPKMLPIGSNLKNIISWVLCCQSTPAKDQLSIFVFRATFECLYLDVIIRQFWVRWLSRGVSIFHYVIYSNVLMLCRLWPTWHSM